MPQLKDSLKKFAGKKIIVIGDIMLDEFYAGEITRISPEAPVPVVLLSSQNYFVGGAANTANNIVSMGGNAVLIGVVGKDEKGKMLLDAIKAKKIDAKNVIVDSTRPTTVKTRILAHGKQLLRYDVEKSGPISQDQEKQILKAFQSRLLSADAVVISDYSKGVITKSLANKAISLANSSKIPILIDSKHYFDFNLSNASALKPNLKELSKETQLDVSQEPALKKALEMMSVKLSPKYIVVTLGERGILVYEKNSMKIIPGIKVSAVDVSGAGDTVISALALGLCAKLPIHEAAQIANYAAACVVQKQGTQVPSLSEIKKLMGNG